MNPILKNILKSIFRRNPAIYDLVIEAATDIMLESANKAFDMDQLQEKIYSEAAYLEMAEMIFNPPQ